MKYPWKRFWCPREGSTNLSDGGFLYDPESKYADLIQPDVIPFEKIAHMPCLALLGEPGIGKSTVMEDLSLSLQKSIESSGDSILYINLNEYGNENRLIKDLFECEKYTTWRNGNHILHLFLDSLDECRIRIPQVATIFINHLNRIRNQLDRLRIRIACRTADWPATLELHLPNLWGDEGFGAYELSPLRRKDIEVAAQTEKIDADKFMAEINRTESIPLAIKPVTLDFLLRVFRGHGELPNTRTELYEEGCKLLCEELNPTRRDLRGVGGAGTLSAQERLSIASQIAAVSMFCGKPTIYVGAAIASVSTEQVSITEIAGNPDLPISQAERLSENQIIETLGTGLFSSRGIDLMGFAHQTYAEFLASRYLRSHNMHSSRILSLLRHSGGPDNHIVPQLYETAAWIAGREAEVFNAIANKEPQVLLRCDEGSLSPEQRVELVDSFLQALHESRTSDRGWDIQRHYKKLAHSGLAKQLRPWIIDAERHINARNAAIDIAEDCGASELQTALADLVLDDNEVERLRSNAAHALAIVGNAETKSRLRPLALGQAGEDSHDQLKGNSLRAVWPDLITDDELFDNLTLPKRENFSGAYQHFVEYELCKQLDISGLPRALKWLETHAAQRRLGFAFNALADDIMIDAWRHMDNPDVLRAMANTAIELLKHHHELVQEEEKRSEYTTQFDDADKRRKLSKAMIEQDIDIHVTHCIVSAWSWPHLMRDDDFDWCVQELLYSISEPTEPNWAALLWTLFMWAEPCGRMLDVFIDARAKSPLLRKESASFFTPVVLNSDQAQKMRDQYEQAQKWQQKKESRLLEWLPRDRIQHYLTRFEKGRNDAWWILLKEMTLEDTSERYKNVFHPDITELPGWRNSDENTRQRILNAAESYLNAKVVFNAKRLLDSSADEKDIAAYKAFLLLLNEQPEKMLAITEDVWGYWVLILFGPFGYDGNKDTQNLLISMAYEKVPNEVADVLAQIVRHQMGKDKYISVLDMVEDIWDDRITDVVYGLLEEAQAKPPCWGRMLTVLLTKGDTRAIEQAKDKLSLPLPEEKLERELALQAALVLIQATDDANWSTIWAVLQAENSFGRDLIKEFAYELHHDPSQFVSKLTEASVADLFIWLVRQFPYEKDPQYNGGYSPTKDDTARELRNRLINVLEKAGTPASCHALQRIASALPRLDWVKSVLVEARQNTLRSTWRPLQPKEFLEVTSKPESVLVRDATELQEVLVDELGELQSLLQSEYAAPDLWDQWDKRSFRPKDESHFSDWIKRNLEPKVKRRGIVVAREVEIRRGEKTDIHVTAVIPGLTNGTFEQVRVIIETKGCWHRELKTAMESQLVERYLTEYECQHGIYLVGWYDCNKWNIDDRRKTNTPKLSLQEAREFFESQAEMLSASGVTIRAVVLNTALR